MKKKSSIIKFSIVGVLVVIGAILSFVPIQIGVRNVNPFFQSIRLGLDLVGGIYAVYEAEPVDGGVVLSEQVEGTRARLESMLVARGFTDATVMREGETRLRVEVPDVADPEELFRIIGMPAQLEFRDDAGNTVLTGDMVTSVSSGWDPGSATNVVHLNLNSEGTRRFANATAPENHGQSIQIVTIVDDVPTVISAPTIQTHITNGRAIITGMESPEAARSLADQIVSGQMEVRLRVLETASISPTLGQGALFLGLLAGAIGLLLIIVFMSVFYKVFGVLSSVALLINVILMLFFLAALPWVQLTLPGIAGILLSIGMATDGNIVMFERIKDEFRRGKSIKAATYAGLKKGFWPVFDKNITSILGALVLLILGTGPIQSFAITMLVGIVITFFNNLVVVDFFTKWALAFNTTDAKRYGLKRGPGFEHLDADKTDVEIAEREEELEEEKRAVREAKKQQKSNKRRLADGIV